MNRRTLALALPAIGLAGVAAAKGVPQKVLAIALDEPPSSLKSFQVMPAPPFAAKPPTARFSVRCAGCGGGTVQVLERTVTWRPADSSREITPVGVSLHCPRCARRSPLFDMRSDGWDGALGHNAFMDGPSEERPLREADGADLPAVEVRASYVFNIPMPELIHASKKSDRRPQDLFDVFVLDALLADGWQSVWDCECA
jgi:hypothetical protein